MLGSLDVYPTPIFSFNFAQVVVSVGGQIPNNLVMPLMKAGVTILGTAPESIDMCEDRNKFSKLCDKLNIDQPEWIDACSLEEAKEFGRRVEYPVLVRPSYVLSGAAMNVADNEADLVAYLGQATQVNRDHPVVVSKFVKNAKEVEMDAVAKDGRIINYAVSEHVENAGVHSGDATLVLPAQKLYVETVRRIKKIMSELVKTLNITGPVNAQFLSKNNDIKVRPSPPSDVRTTHTRHTDHRVQPSRVEVVPLRVEDVRRQLHRAGDEGHGMSLPTRSFRCTHKL